MIKRERGDTMQKTYLKNFYMPSEDREFNYLKGIHMTCFDTFYPFKVLPSEFRELEFFPLTILYGGNGCGKTTILNLIAEKLGINRSTRINKTSFMEDYLDLCDYDIKETPTTKKIITSDDVFSDIFRTREKNEIIDQNRKQAFELSDLCHTPGVYIRDVMDEMVGDGKWIDNLDTLLKVTAARQKSKSQFARETVQRNIIGKSNGETALEYFYSNIKEPGLYLLDEPENSLSAIYQRTLAQYLAESVRFFDAQLIIATHSPFMLSIPGARIYDLDAEEFCITDDWTTLDNMMEYYRLFRSYAECFEER